MNFRVLFAIFKRNFFSYFANPTGYVFICGFVLVSGFAAFWPHEFFNANLANLDQLNRYLPFIMLGFVPAITMSIWAEERRLGTDELLLTLPASDLDVVLGKYLAAVAIFTVSLLFSSAANIFVLFRLGNPDIGLLITTCLGYWFVGIAMLAVGMVASFLTSNLTVGFVLGVALNAPLVFAATNDVIISNPSLVQSIRQWSISALFADFARGVVSASSVIYFLSIVAIGLYLSMVLIGRRHWVSHRSNTAGAPGGPGGGSMIGHFICRTVAVVVIAVGLSLIFRVHDVRVDASSEKLSSLSPKSVELLSELGNRRVSIEAFISPEDKVPESYIQTRINLLNTLSEIQKRSNGKVSVEVHETETFKPEKTIADQRYGIKARTVYMQDRGQIKQYDIFMGVAINSGLDKRVIEFVDRGVPTEYELVSRIASIAIETKKKTIGVVRTDAQLMGQMSMMMMGQPPEGERIITELQRQYEVVEVNANMPIEKRYDALLVVQPSSLEQPQLDNLIAAIRSGIPAAIFEDPTPILAYQNGRAAPPPGTLDPRRPQQMDPMMARMGMQPQMPGPKGRLSDLWDLLGCELPVRKKRIKSEDGSERTSDVIDIVWQEFNPFPRASTLDAEIVFIGKTGGAFADDEITRGLQYVMFPYAGAIARRPGSKMLFTPLATTGATAGVFDNTELFIENEMGGKMPNTNRKRVSTGESYVVAARIEGKASPDSPNMHVVLVSDIDLLASFFFGHRDQGADERMPFYFDVDNVTFGLNIMDSLAGEKGFFDIRGRRRVHRTLTAFEKSTEAARKKTLDEKADAQTKLEEKLDELRLEHRKRIGELVKERIAGEIDDRQLTIKKDAAESQLSRVLLVERERLNNLRDEKIEKAEADLELNIRQIQNNEKRLAVFIPPLFPALIALLVFGWRRTRELEGAVKSRLR
jgi:ABC-2 type transport system permease protein